MDSRVSEALDWLPGQPLKMTRVKAGWRRRWTKWSHLRDRRSWLPPACMRLDGGSWLRALAPLGSTPTYEVWAVTLTEHCPRLVGLEWDLPR